jgi:hypothetical protein
MMRRLALLLMFVSVGAVYACQANAEIDDLKYGADLERACNSAAQQERQDCAAYVALAIASTRMMQKRANQCLFYDAPEDLSSGAAVKVLTDWLREHRNRGEVEAGFVVDSAMKDSFPCQN